MGWKTPHEFSDVQRVFPAQIMEHLPPWEEIPDDFKNESHSACNVLPRWMFGDLFTKEPMASIVGKEGVSAKTIFYHIDTILRSYEPKHEHKEAGVAYMISLWVRSVIKGDEVVYGEDLRQELKELKESDWQHEH